MEVSRLKFDLNGAPGDLFERLKENHLAKVSFLKVFNKGEPPRMFPLASNLLKMDVYSNDFQKIFLAKNPRDNQNKSDQIVASVNTMNNFHF